MASNSAGNEAVASEAVSDFAHSTAHPGAATRQSRRGDLAAALENCPHTELSSATHRTLQVLPKSYVQNRSGSSRSSISCCETGSWNSGEPTDPTVCLGAGLVPQHPGGLCRFALLGTRRCNRQRNIISEADAASTGACGGGNGQPPSSLSKLSAHSARALARQKTE